MSLWRDRYPGAAALLARWTRDHRQTAVKLEAWERQNPEKMRVLTDWAATHEYESLGAFFFTRPGWGGLQQIDDDDHEAVRSFLTWLRSAPDAARELMAHDDALAYADTHWSETGVDAALLTSAHVAGRGPARGTSLGIEQGGAPTGPRGVAPIGIAPPPKPAEPVPPEDRPATPKPVYPY